MSKEVSGYINRVVLHDNGTVTKMFEDRGLAQRSASSRQLAEVEALIQQPMAPQFIHSFGNEVTMSEVEGERDIDNVVCELDEAKRAAIFLSAGQSLRQIHALHTRPVGDRFHRQTVQENLALLNDLSSTLASAELDNRALAQYAANAYPRDEISRLGLVHTHGDFWLNNLIGEYNNGTFAVNGVIDWEMGGLGSPYFDFSVVNLSILRPHEGSANSFWEGYGENPSPDAIDYFSITQVLQWMMHDSMMDLSGEFYQDKIKFIKEIV